MIVLHESAAVCKISKFLLCPKCKHGKIGKISQQSTAVISRRGKPPPNEQGEYIQVKCAVCGTLWSLTIK